MVKKQSSTLVQIIAISFRLEKVFKDDADIHRDVKLTTQVDDIILMFRMSY